MTGIALRFSGLITIAVGLSIFVISALANEQSNFKAKQCAEDRALSKQEQKELLALHLPSGAPSHRQIHVRRAYVTEYDASRRLPRWVAWSATKAFRDPPKRKGRWSAFHPDPDVADSVTTNDYKGVFNDGKGFARGHITPYYISGGDRDNDGLDAEFEDHRGLPVEDPDDACTVFEINYMSNITPQYHNKFNGVGGLWYKLETAIRALIDAGHEFHLIAGPAFVTGPVQKIGPHSDIHVPHSFFKIVISNNEPIAFLFAHDDRVDAPGCSPDAALEKCIKSVDEVETATGLDFFSALSDTEQQQLEATPNKPLWSTLHNQ